MGRFFRRLWSYMGASANKKFDDRADPEVQINQAIEEAQRQHAALSQQAAAVLGNRRQIELQLARLTEETGKMQAQARQSLVLADNARQAGDVAKATQYETTAQAFATQLVTLESQVEDTKTLHAQAVQNSDGAKAAVEQNRMRLQQSLDQKSKLLSQLQAAKMQEQMSAALHSMSSLSAPDANPTMDQVRDKIEKRYSTAMGASELASESLDSRMLDVQKATIDVAAQSRLDQIRASLGQPSTGGTGPVENPVSSPVNTTKAPPAAAG